MRVLVAGALLALVGCSDAAADAERQYEIVAKEGDDRQICDAAKKVAAAHLKAENENQYSVWNTRAQVYCAKSRY